MHWNEAKAKAVINKTNLKRRSAQRFENTLFKNNAYLRVKSDLLPKTVFKLHDINYNARKPSQLCNSFIKVNHEKSNCISSERSTSVM